MIARALERLVDARVGVVKYVREQPRRPEFPDLFQFAAEAADTGAFSPQRNFRFTGGAALERDHALAKAVGEAVERYCAALYEVDEQPLVSLARAPFPCAPPEEFALNSPAQYAEDGFPWRPWTADTPVRWVPALDVRAGRTVHVPAAFVYVPYYYYVEDGDTPIGQPISTGLACHGSWAAAAVAGVCEVIERDAFTLTWQARLALPRIRPASLTPVLRELYARITATRARLELFATTLDHGVPTVIAVQRHDAPDMPAITFGAAAALDPAVAARKAMEEIAHTGRWMYVLKRTYPPREAVPGFVNIASQEDHLSFWNDHRHRPLADFVCASAEGVDLADLGNLDAGSAEQNLAVLCERVAAVGHRVLVAELTTPDIRETGLTVVRALIPGFHPLIMGYRIRCLGGRRLWTVPVMLGYPGIDPTVGDNPAPHPFP